MTRKRLRLWVAGLLITAAVAVPLAVAAQRGFFGRRSFVLPNAEYDGRFTFARIRYQGYRSWDADYPLMEQNLTAMLQELTSMNPNVDETNVHTFDDPELLKYPVAYLTEPGYWFPTDEEVVGLRTYLAKGGFLIVDDFHFANEWSVFEQGIRRVLPNLRFDELQLSHPAFSSFFEIKSLQVPYPGNLGEQGLMGEFYGIHEDNDPTKRLMVVINYNIDLGDYVEWAQSSRAYSFTPTNEAYKFMINYVVYGLTH